ncbi:branched chain amino acid aminotransferase [Rhizobium rhizosphaerae]|uniref:Branched-chain-amino-acid aminotransferase n=1 Tax=Xaviernesmea rhizosphaerae TaxID=1672749 RepID=A0A1Q9AIB3_9HYPH|nr:branched-chain amino acid aminotransferase [Xaviernesmea rhizosphaerae]OLP54947.1 branched chain amino acid aminotransferase [Xaviernesmea rhizosphaerae]
MSANLTFDISRNPNPMPPAERQKALEHLGFGTLFSDHMAIIEWDAATGWHSARVAARRPFEIDPAAAVLHYGQEIFEGMKAYRNGEGQLVLFRPEENARRFNASAERMAMPPIPEALFLEAVEQLVRVDADWVPAGEGASLYLRPFMFASEAFLGVRPSQKYIFSVIACPVGPYFSGGAKPITVWVTEDYSRAARGGTGAAKCGGNYAASLAAQARAYEEGCAQVVFLDAAEQKWIEELGGMNIFFVFDDNRIVTPELGTILPGITRQSLLTLAREEGLEVSERPYAFADWKADSESGRLREVFACGTAAVVASIGEAKFEGGSLRMGNGAIGPVTERLHHKLTGIQRGTEADTHGWVRVIS